MLWKVEQDERNLKEQFQYPDMAFPFSVWPDIYNTFLDSRVDAHWHYDFEYSYMVSGSLDYYINDTYVKLEPGDFIFVNSNMLHMAKLPDGCDNAIAYTMAFPTTLLTSDINSTLYKKYLRPLIGTHLEGFKISAGHPLGKELADLTIEMLKVFYPASMLTSKSISKEYRKYFQDLIDNHLDKLIIDTDDQMYQDIVDSIRKNAKDGPEPGFELECMNRVIQVLGITVRYIKENNEGLLWRTGSMVAIERAREILAYMHARYHERMTVEDIAKHVSISRNECFRCFKNFIGKNPIEYLNDYRLLMAAQLLSETEKSVEEISAECGFASASFFGKVFKKKYNTTPLQFRRKK